MRRREFIIGVAAKGAAANALPVEGSSERMFCFFSKHLPELGYSELGRVLKDAGFDGEDLTMRKGAMSCPNVCARTFRGQLMRSNLMESAYL
jgi:hypothetical protein